MRKNEKRISEALSEEAILEALLERAGEVIASASKRLRILRNEDYLSQSAVVNSQELETGLIDLSISMNCYGLKSGMDSVEVEKLREARAEKWLNRIGLKK